MYIDLSIIFISDISHKVIDNITAFVLLTEIDDAASGISIEKKINDEISVSNHTGILVHKNKDLEDMISHARGLGFRVEIHAIGDAAAEQVGLGLLL
jgi:hypothetical protein